MNRRNFIKTTSAATISGLLLPSMGAFASGFKSANGYVAAQKADILSFVDSIAWKNQGWGRWKYNSLMERDYALESSGMAVQILDYLNQIPQVGKMQKKEGIEFLLSLQDPKDKYFKDPFVSDEQRVSQHHSWEHIWAHMSAVSISALNILGHKMDKLETKAPFVDLSKTDIGDWLHSLNWKNPWMHGEQLTKVIKYYWDHLDENERSLEDPVITKAYNIIENEILDPQTGLPEKAGCTNKAVAMAGLFKLMSGYMHIGKTIPNAERALDSVLGLQMDNGEFGYGKTCNNMCINWDAMWVIYYLNKQLEASYRIHDIKATGNRAAEFLINVHKKGDGGFSFHRNHCQGDHNSIYVSPKGPVGDMQGTRQVLLCLSYADEWNKL